MTVDLERTACAICGPGVPANELYAARFDAKAFTSQTFSARRLPDRIHYRMVKCQSCGLLRSDPAMRPEHLRSLYSLSAFTYHEETTNLRLTYGRYLKRLEGYGGRRESLLEIGCGNGFFLEEALEQGFTRVAGVEPSRQAVMAASTRVRGSIVEGVFDRDTFAGDAFDVIAAFQLLDHLAEPATALSAIKTILKPGGLILMLHHNAAAFSARLMGERSPIVDIEHLFLYTPATMRKICEKAGLEVLEARSAWNRVSVQHLLSLIPLPMMLKRFLLTVAESSRAGRLPLLLPLGNMVVIARKPR